MQEATEEAFCKLRHLKAKEKGNFIKLIDRNVVK